MQFSLIDSHSHVQFSAYDQDREAVVERALSVGIGMINIGTQYSTSAGALGLAEKYPDGVWATVGFHPGHIGPNAHHDPSELREARQVEFDYREFRELAEHPKVVAVGECGLDYYRGGRGQGIGDSMKERQRDVFAQHIELAKEIGKPLVIHCRNAFADLLNMLSPIRYPLTPRGSGVVHFFSGSWDDARKLLDLGFYLGFGGVITFARDYDQMAVRAPLERMLVETDAPYVAPVPYRGQRNEPAFIVETVRKIAELRGISYDEVAEATVTNTRKLFGL